MQTAENTRDILKLKSDMGFVEKQMSDVMDQLGDVVTKSDLAEMMKEYFYVEHHQKMPVPE